MPAPGVTPGRFGRYEILQQIAVGGMAEIHLARVAGIQGFEKLVVVKRILPHLAAQAEVVQMFLDEARIAATLHHSNIVQVYDIGESGGSYFLAMEFLHGADVNRMMRRTVAARRPVPLEHAVNIAVGVCAGLHYAHERLGNDGQPLHIVHRDVSPQNIFVTYDGGVKLVDFGIAKAAHRLTTTRLGTLKGKVRYMSPEQCDKQTIDRRSDVFAAAVVLWEMTTGRRLRQGETEFQIMKSIVEQDAPAPSTVRAGYPPELERIVLKGLRRDPAERHQTAQELQLELEAFAREHKLAVSSITLAQYMRELFAPEIEAWLEAQRQGQAFAAHISHALSEPHLLTPSIDTVKGNLYDCEPQPPGLATSAPAGQEPRAGAGPAPGQPESRAAPGEAGTTALGSSPRPMPPESPAPAGFGSASRRWFAGEPGASGALDGSAPLVPRGLHAATRASMRPVLVVLGLALAVFATAGIVLVARREGPVAPVAPVGPAAAAAPDGPAPAARPGAPLRGREVSRVAPHGPADADAPAVAPGSRRDAGGPTVMPEPRRDTGGPAVTRAARRDAGAATSSPRLDHDRPGIGPQRLGQRAAVKPRKAASSGKTPAPARRTKRGDDLDDPLPRP
ncbi:MAG: protein kinase [Gemmatimonadales bacterium]|nr:protein kinase [Gemmatimonadales bacterium]